MNSHILIQIIFSFFLMISTSAVDDAQSMALLNCPSMCGYVSIPYPFGMGKGCYHDEWYAITCDNTFTPSKPFLTKFNLEVLSVDLKGYVASTISWFSRFESLSSITVMNPVASNCPQQKGNTIWSSSNFTGSPYSYGSDNDFVVMGNDSAVFINYPQKTNFSCLPSCDTDGVEGCNGINSCRIPLRFLEKSFAKKKEKFSKKSVAPMNFYTVSVEENTTIGCTYAFLTLKPSLYASFVENDNITDQIYSKTNSTKQVPVELFWLIKNPKSNKYCKDVKTRSIFPMDVKSKVEPSSSSGLSSYCRCPWAHTGNPYIPDGCKIVEACANCETNCRKFFGWTDESVDSLDLSYYRCGHKTESIPASAVDDAQSMALPKCPSMCGNISIPYPFGIGKGCYHDEWYAITCDNTFNPSKPFLTKFNMEVLEVDLDVFPSSITVMNPVASNCPQQKGNTIWSSTNLSGSPYSFSSSNSFVVVGNDSAVFINYPQKTSFRCLPECKSDSAKDCSGIVSCKIALGFLDKSFAFKKEEFSKWSVAPMDFYTVSVEENTKISCTYAFLRGPWADEGSIYTTKQVPVQLVWLIKNRKRSKFCKDVKTRSIFPMDVKMKVEPSSSPGLSSYCQCPRTHTGNPYIPDGCKIVEACANCKTDCQEVPGPDYHFRCGHRVEIILGSSFGGGLSFLLVCGFCFWVYKLIKKKRIASLKKKFFKRNGGLLLEQQISSDEGAITKTILFTSDELLKATDNFNEDRILGQGGQGTVYKGMLTDGRITAVKKSKIVDESQLEQFINEVVILSQINHRNIVKLLGCCLETEVPLLVYEFVLNGTLSDLVHHEKEEFPLSWKMRLQIATEVAGALAYLHSASFIPIYHRDIKSSNILLDEKFETKIADFGTSRSITIEQTHLTTFVYGTFGYLDPEYFRSGQYTDKSDVYSFGVVLAELLTGQKAVYLDESDEHRGLAGHFFLCAEQMRVFDIVDARIFEEAPKEEVLALANIASRCLNLNRAKRPTMKEVMMDLEVMSREPIAAPTILTQDTFNI